MEVVFFPIDLYLVWLHVYDCLVAVPERLVPRPEEGKVGVEIRRLLIAQLAQYLTEVGEGSRTAIMFSLLSTTFNQLRTLPNRMVLSRVVEQEEWLLGVIMIPTPVPDLLAGWRLARRTRGCRRRRQGRLCEKIFHLCKAVELVLRSVVDLAMGSSIF